MRHLGPAAFGQARRGQPALLRWHGLRRPGRDSDLPIRSPFLTCGLDRSVLAELHRHAAGPVDRLRERLRQPALREAYLRWLARHDGAAAPAPTAFGIADLPEDAVDCAFLAEVQDAAEGRYRFLHVGRALEERLGRHLTGEVISASTEDRAIGEALGGNIVSAYDRCVRNGSPFYDYARFALGDDSNLLLERIVLPLSADGAAITHVAGVAIFTETKLPDAG